MDFINFYDSDNVTLLDSISAEYEDTFSLDAFSDIIEAYVEFNKAAKDEAPAPGIQKSFIIARIQTADIKQPNKCFYSYYAANNLNKILFQTQQYLGKRLLHRMLVLIVYALGFLVLLEIRLT